MKKRTSYDLSPKGAIRESQRTGEIVHVVCEDRAAAVDYCSALRGESEIDDWCDAEEWEHWGKSVRVHVSVQEES